MKYPQPELCQGYCLTLQLNPQGNIHAPWNIFPLLSYAGQSYKSILPNFCQSYTVTPEDSVLLLDHGRIMCATSIILQLETSGSDKVAAVVLPAYPDNRYKNNTCTTKNSCC